jgi:V/A-type H+/Na+-transporting ATPase subunit D
MKLTKNELRIQQTRLSQLSKYLPTLQLKKSMLQYEVDLVEREIDSLKEEYLVIYRRVELFSPLLLEKVETNLLAHAEVQHVKKIYENIAGVEIPRFSHVLFREVDYFLFDTPVWTESATELLRELVIAREKIAVAEEKQRALKKELREVSIRVNLFEKILIPRATEHIKKIRIFLSDQQLASVAQAKVAKAKLLFKKNQKAEDG